MPVNDKQTSSENTGTGYNLNWTVIRLTAVVGLVIGLWGIGHYTGIIQEINAEQIRSTVESAGAWGIVLFLMVFSAGVLMHVPGMVFVAGAAFAYGGLLGAGISLLGALIAVTVSFIFVRWVGGQQAHKLQWSFAQRILKYLDTYPILSVALLRVLLWLSPPLNYALALTRVRLRDYVLGSFLGLLGPVFIVVYFVDWFF